MTCGGGNLNKFALQYGGLLITRYYTWILVSVNCRVSFQMEKAECILFVKAVAALRGADTIIYVHLERKRERFGEWGGEIRQKR